MLNLCKYMYCALLAFTTGGMLPLYIGCSAGFSALIILVVLAVIIKR